jgi:NOL1/NOP2/sun family putative RNA methylase
VKLEKLFDRYKQLIPDYNGFIAAVRRPLVKSFRINTLKAEKNAVLLLLKDLKLKQLPYYEDGFIVEHRAPLGNHITHSLGLIYVQEIASMIPVFVLDPKPGEYVLDLCAAPGSKTTQIAQMMNNRGLLVANEINRKRMQGLIHNIKRCGVYNEAVIQIKGQRIDKILPEYFDRVLVDAPCSAEGTIRRSKSVLSHWGEKNIQRMSHIQKGLIASAFRTLRPGGTMVYSTCTIAPEENESVVAYLLGRFPEADLMSINIPHFKTHPAITKWKHESYEDRIKKCVRIMPQDNDTAPFFIARIMKRGVLRQRVGYMGKIDFEGSSIDLLNRRFGCTRQRFDGLSIFQKNEMSYITTPDVFSFWEIKAVRKGLEVGKIYGHEIKPDNDFIQLFGKDPVKNFYTIKEWQAKKIMEGNVLKIGEVPGLDRGFVVLMYKKLPVAMGRYNGTDIKSAVKRDRRIP